MIGRLLLLWLLLGLCAVTDHGRLTLGQVRKLPATVDVGTAARALGISRSTLYEAIKIGQSPVRVIAVKRRIVVLTADLVRVLEGGDAGASIDAALTRECDRIRQAERSGEITSAQAAGQLREAHVRRDTRVAGH